MDNNAQIPAQPQNDETIAAQDNIELKEESTGEQDLLEILGKQLYEAQEQYPAIDMDEQLQNPRFMELLYGGLDIKSSYELANAENLRNEAISKALKEAKLLWMNELKAANQRPIEEASQGGISASAIKNPALMSREERDLIAQRAARGETITFE